MFFPDLFVLFLDLFVFFPDLFVLFLDLFAFLFNFFDLSVTSNGNKTIRTKMNNRNYIKILSIRLTDK